MTKLESAKEIERQDGKCKGVACNYIACPVFGSHVCSSVSNKTLLHQQRVKLAKQFIKESEMKEMPKLEAGMVMKLKFDHYIPSNNYYVYINEKTAWCLNGIEGTQDFRPYIVAIYKKLWNFAFNDQGNGLSSRLIWEKQVKTQEQIQIEKLEKTIAEATEQIQELKKARE